MATSARSQQAVEKFNSGKAAQQSRIGNAAGNANAAGKRAQDAADAASFARGGHGWTPQPNATPGGK